MMRLFQWVADSLNRPTFMPQNNNPVKAAEIAISEKNHKALSAATDKLLPFLDGNPFMVETLSVIADKFMEMSALAQIVERQADVQCISEAIRISRVILEKSADREFKQKAADLILNSYEKLKDNDDRIDALMDVARCVEPGVSYRAPRINREEKALTSLEEELKHCHSDVALLRAYGRAVEKSATDSALEKMALAGVHKIAAEPSIPQNERYAAYRNVFNKVGPTNYYKHTTAQSILTRFSDEDKGLPHAREKTGPEDRVQFYQDLIIDGNEHYQTNKTVVEGFIASVQALRKPQDRISELTKALPQSYENTLLHTECVRALYKNVDTLPTQDEKLAALKEAKEFCTFDKSLRTEIIRKVREIESLAKAPDHHVCIDFVTKTGGRKKASYGWVPGPM